jgi:hypothetical protein
MSHLVGIAHRRIVGLQLFNITVEMFNGRLLGLERVQQADIVRNVAAKGEADFCSRLYNGVVSRQ